jgi:DNA-binding transcriptional MerR regulator
MAPELGIGDLAREAGCTAQAIRWYEANGLLPAAPRTGGNQRRYDPRHLARLAFIRHARELGFTLDDVRQLLSLADDPSRPCAEADAIARRHLVAVEERIARLDRLRTELKRMVAGCARGKIAQCRVIEVIADHSHGHCLGGGHDGAEAGALAARRRKTVR